MAAARRIGTEDSATRGQLVDAAEALLLSSGYAAVTSRKVAAEAGLKPQLVHYYFRTMDDLFVEVFRRRADENIARYRRAVAEDGSLHRLWELSADVGGARFMSEFVALAHHRPQIRAEVAAAAERFRTVQLAAMRRALASAPAPASDMPPVVVLLLLLGVTQVLALEQSLGVTAGHRTTVRFIEDAVARLDGRR